MDQITADPRQTEVFVKSAMDRYAEKGVPEKQAEELLAGAMEMAGSKLGLVKDAARTRIDNYKSAAVAELAKIVK